jgi:alkanesulfonate monooxygenase SsuD/methylene tetrahydromethanopterin reductase-like flavin-dependent oxidoreductase (luciferase family)
MQIGFLAAMTAQGGDIAEIARATEAAGFESLWIPEHPVIPAANKNRSPLPPGRQITRTLWPLG